MVVIMFGVHDSWLANVPLSLLTSCTTAIWRNCLNITKLQKAEMIWWGTSPGIVPVSCFKKWTSNLAKGIFVKILFQGILSTKNYESISKIHLRQAKWRGLFISLQWVFTYSVIWVTVLKKCLCNTGIRSFT